MKQKVVVQNGTPFVGFLGLLFIALKLTGFIDWSWWWVLAPFWAVPAIYIFVFVVAMLFALIHVAFRK